MQSSPKDGGSLALWCPNCPLQYTVVRYIQWPSDRFHSVSDTSVCWSEPRFCCTWYLKGVTELDVESPLLVLLDYSARLLSMDGKGYSWGPPRGSSGEFGTKVRTSILAGSQDSLPNIGNIQSNNLRVVQGSKPFGKVRHLLPHCIKVGPLHRLSWV
jgi:hypothetical protein